MSDMPLLQTLLLLAAIVVLIAATQWRDVHPFLALVIVASAFGWAAGFPTGFLGKSFGTGFAQAIYSPGLLIVAAGFVAGLAGRMAAPERLRAAIGRWRWLGSTRIASLVGLFAGVGASPAASFAVLTPLLPPIGGATPPRRAAAATALALALSASHGLVLPAPVMIAAASILGAGWTRVAVFGLPLAVLLAAFGAVWARWLSARSDPSSQPMQEPAQEPSQEQSQKPHEEQSHVAAKRGGGPAIALVLAAAVPLAMLMVRSLGDMPSEPLGGGPSREMVLGFGRPLILFLVGVGIMSLGRLRLSLKLIADTAWTTRILGNAAVVMLIVAAAGGWQKLCQETGMAELIGERFAGWPIHGFAAVLVPFLVAASIKTLQGSSLVAAITAAGMMQPLLFPLGLSGANGTALAALAVGAGAMTISHLNDEFFWLVSTTAGLNPLRGIAALSIATLLQGLIAIAALLAASGLAANL